MTEFFTTHTGQQLAYSFTNGVGPTVIFLGGFKSDMEGSKAIFLENWAQKRKRSFLRFDYSGHGQSTGDFLKLGIGDWLNDARQIIELIDNNEVILVGGSARMPKVQASVQKLFNKEPHKGVNPDEVVSIGASIQGGVLKGEVKDVLLLDVTPLTLGIETMGGVFTPLIERKTTIPAKKTEIFSTAADNQPAVEIHVLQGERKVASGNKSVERFNLDGIPPAPRGTPQIEVTFDIDANGILKVSAKDLGTGKEQHITVTASSGLSDEEIDKMMKDAEVHAAEDEKLREKIDLKNQADSTIFQTEKFLTDNEDKISEEQKKEVQLALDPVKKALESEDYEAMKSSLDALNEKMQAAATEMYAQAQQGSSSEDVNDQSAEGNGEKTASNVEEADFEIVDEDEADK